MFSVSAERYDAKVTIQFGKAACIGDSSGEGSDREQRDRARAIFETHIRGSNVPRSSEIWADIRDRWGKAPAEEEVGPVLRDGNLPSQSIIIDVIGGYHYRQRYSS
jgi:hypothetical protein